MEFIVKNALFYQGLIPKELCQEILNKVDENKIWNIIKDKLPNTCNGGKLLKMGKIEYCKYDSNTVFTLKKRYQNDIYDDLGNCSPATLYIFCNDLDFGHVVFYANPKRDLIAENETFYAKSIAGNAIFFTNKVAYIEHPVISGTKYFLKIPIFYSSQNIPIKSKTKKTVTFGGNQTIRFKKQEPPVCINNPILLPMPSHSIIKNSAKPNSELFSNNFKTFEIPTPNGLKFTNAEIVDPFGRTILLTPCQDFNSLERWNEVINAPKNLKFYPQEILNPQKGRPPTYQEDYCPNCYEIIPLNEPITNCSGCLSPI